MTDPIPTTPEPEVVPEPEPTPKPIYGGEPGMAASTIRRLVATVILPDRRNIEFQARNMLVEADIREAMAQAALSLHKHFMTRNYSAMGWTFDPEAIEYDFQRLAIGMDVGADTQVKHTEGLARTLIATVVIRR